MATTKSNRKAYFTLFLTASVLLAAYSYNTALSKYFINTQTTQYTRSEQGSNLDEVDVDLIALELDIPFEGLFWVYEANPANNPWEDPNETFFRIAAYDEYDITDNEFAWGVSSDLSYKVALAGDTESSNEVKWKIKLESTLAGELSTRMPSISPSARVKEHSLTTAPYTSSSDLNMEKQLYLEDLFFEAEYTEGLGNKVNITYELMYDSNDYQSAEYYRTNSLPMGSYTASEPVVVASLLGPRSGSNNLAWLTYKNNNPHFSAVVDELATDGAFVAAPNTYQSMEAIVDYVASNFQLDYENGGRPDDGDDPVEWFCEEKSTKYPFEFTSLIVSLARYNGIAAQYLTGYRWNDAFTSSNPEWKEYSDPEEDGDTAYCFRLINTYTLANVFIPTSAGGGDWIEFDNKFSFSGVPESYTIRFDDEFLPDVNGYSRFDGGPTIIDVDVTVLTASSSPVIGLDVEIKDITTDTVLTTIATDTNGNVTYDLDVSTWTNGPHIINFSSEMMEVEFGNVSIVDIVEPMQIYIDSFTPSDHIINSNTPSFSINGFVWDPYLNAGIKNAEVNVSRLLNGGSGAYNFSHSVVTDAAGNFTVFANLTGIFDISADLQSFPQDIRDIFETNNLVRLPQHLAHIPPYIDVKSILQVKYLDNTYYEYSAWINGTNSSSNPAIVVVNRDTGYLNFTASTWHADDWENGHMEVTDLTDPEWSGLTIQTFNSPLNGNNSITYKLSDDTDARWSVGPHKLRVAWTNSPNPTATREDIWIFVNDTVRVKMYTMDYTSGTGPAFSYNISSAVPANTDNVPINASVQDKGDGYKTINYVRMYYRVFDKNWLPKNDTYLENGNFAANLGASYYHQEIFQFKSTVPTGGTEPVRTDAYFRGEWMNVAGGGWDNSWNALWSSTIEIVNASSNAFYLNDPSLMQLTATLDGVSFTNIIGNPIYLDGNSFNITGEFRIGAGNTPKSGVTVFLNDMTTGQTWSNVTNIHGNASFHISYNSTVRPGPHKYRIYLTYLSTEKESILGIVYNKSLSIDALRVDYEKNLTMGSTLPAHTISISGVLLDGDSNAYYHATLKAWVTKGGKSYPADDYLNIIYNFNMNTGHYTVTITAKTNMVVGNWTVIIGFDGTLSGAPTEFTGYKPIYLAVNASVEFTVYDKTATSTDYLIETFDGTPSITPGGTNITVWGYLTYGSNSSVIIGKDIYIRMYHVNGSYEDFGPIVTNGTGGYMFKIITEFGWDPDYYVVSYASDDDIFVIAAPDTTQTL